MRSKRIRQWLILAIIALAIWGIGEFVEYKQSLPEKQPLTVYAPDDMEKAFKRALSGSELSDSHYIVMSDDPDSNICVGYAKEGDSSYEKFAYSPFVVAYSDEESLYKKLKKADVCFESAYDSNNYEIDFLRVIEEAIGEGKWENLGITKQGDLKVFYPSEKSVYWSDFHDFLLITVNDGIYPKSEAELEAAEEIILQFLDSKYTEGVTDFKEQTERTNGFPSTVIYILPEKDARTIIYDDASGERVRFFYPTKTVYVNYYIKGDELGKQVIDTFDKENFWGLNFYSRLKANYYRSASYTELDGSNEISGDGNVYNVATIPETKEFTTSPTIPETSENPTSE